MKQAALRSVKDAEPGTASINGSNPVRPISPFLNLTQGMGFELRLAGGGILLTHGPGP